MKSLFAKEPAVLFQIVAGLATAATAAWTSATVNGVTNWWLLLLGLIPVVSGVLTRNGVVPVASVDEVADRVAGGANAANELAKLVKGEIHQNPTPRRLP